MTNPPLEDVEEWSINRIFKVLRKLEYPDGSACLVIRKSEPVLFYVACALGDGMSRVDVTTEG